MRAMEYTPAEKRNDGLDMYFVYSAGAAAKVWMIGPMVDTRIAHKRLTDAECAAEYWRAEHHYLRFEDGDPGQYKAVTQAETWHRFATHPHASEVDQ